MATLDFDSGSVTTESLDSSFESLDSRFWKRFPYARDDKAETDEDTPVNVDVLNNDSRASKVFAINIDAKGDGHGIWQIVKPGDSVTDETGAILTLEDDYTIDVDPNGKFEDLNDGDKDTISFKYGVYGPESWKYGYFGWDDATVTVTVKGITDGEPENHAPVAVNDYKFVNPYLSVPVP